MEKISARISEGIPGVISVGINTGKYPERNPEWPEVGIPKGTQRITYEGIQRGEAGAILTKSIERIPEGYLKEY